MFFFYSVLHHIGPHFSAINAPMMGLSTYVFLGKNLQPTHARINIDAINSIISYVETMSSVTKGNLKKTTFACFARVNPPPLVHLHLLSLLHSPKLPLKSIILVAIFVTFETY
ncbi:hypothetical protein AAZX31_14G092500 [Glycine max]